MKKYYLAIALIIGAILFQIYPLFASFIPSTSTVPAGSNGQLQYNNNGTFGAVSNGFSTSSPYGYNEINIGASASSSNPSGMLNLYDESTSSPVLSSSFMGSTTQYVQMFGQNLNPQGSMDLVFADDKGTATSTDHYFDFGIANSQQSDSAHTLIGGLDSYIYSQSGRLLLGSATTSASSSIVLTLGMQSSSPSLTYDQYGHLITHGSSPTITSGGGTSPSITGNDDNGVINLGAGATVTSVVIAFAHSYPTGSSVTCSVNPSSTLASASVTAVSTTGFTAGLSVSLGSGKIYYQCEASN